MKMLEYHYIKKGRHLMTEVEKQFERDMINIYNTAKKSVATMQLDF